jgi:hypothetical protein
MPPPPAQLAPQASLYETARSQSRKRQATISSSSRSDTYTKRIADSNSQLHRRQLELEIQAKELQNRELQQRLDREALEFEMKQLEFRKALQEANV